MAKTVAGRSAVWPAVAALLVALTVSGPVIAANTGTSPRARPAVLVLYAESRVTPAILGVDEALRSQLAATAPGADLFTEYLDLSWTLGGAYETHLVQFLRAKYEGRHIDVVVPVASTALRFALAHRDELFPGVSMVFCVVDRGGESGVELGPDVTGVWLVPEAGTTLAAARRLQPELRRVVVVGGASPLDRIFLESVRQDLVRNPPGLDVSYLAGLAFAELRQRLAALPPHTVALYVSLLRDGAGQPFTSPAAVSALSAASNAPGYGLSEGYVGRGVVGGRVVRFDQQGRQAAQLIGRVLAGERAGAIPPIEGGGNADMFDWRQLRRFRLDERRLPRGSIIVNRPVTLWEQYRWHVVGGGVLIAGEAILIGLLMGNRARRRRAERSLSERLSFEMLLSEISTAMALVAPGDVGTGIDAALRWLGHQLHLDRVTLTEVSPETGGGRLTHAWSAAGATPMPIGCDRDRFPWVTARIDRGEIVHVARLAALPDAAAVDRSSFVQQGIRSSVVVPLIAGNRVMGALALSAIHREREWSSELVQRLQLIAGLFADGLVHARGEAELQRLRSELTHMGRVTTSGELTASLAHELRATRDGDPEQCRDSPGAGRRRGPRHGRPGGTSRRS